MNKNTGSINGENNFEKTIREYLKQGKEKLEHELSGTREAIKIIARDKTRDFIKTMDRGLNKQEVEYMNSLIMRAMYQSFCYGYGIGKMEGKTNSKVYL